MKTTVFQLTNPKSVGDVGIFSQEETVYRVPTLPAYSIIDCTLDYHDRMSVETGNLRPQFEIEGDKVRVKGTSIFWGGNSGQNRLIVHYAGMRDYSLLFPSIDDKVRRQRLGQYAEEAEKSLDSGAWMSFVVMSGAVIEGLLGAYTQAYRFDGMIKEAKRNSILTEQEALLCTEIKDVRNRIHAGEFDKPGVDRTLAMDTYLIYDRLIKRHWDLPTNQETMPAEAEQQE